MVIINGQACSADGISVAEYLSSLGNISLRVAVELNGNIVPRAKYEDTFLADGDRVEIVHFVGGG